ncbi:hypothetical protein SteCoe_8155 [Stentor coeruleus]|uniref:Uncharacterized protein n=1 Tax=Stentor coeruleus TaxID=5963 RepID=A0A1R2CKS9_9CILI|nr:hypothetical protein SteCoe_8155 [Stentor coeruleus]
MAKLIKEIENLLLCSELKKANLMLSSLFARAKNPITIIETLYQLGKDLINKNYISEATLLLRSLKDYTLGTNESLLLTDVKNLLSYCYRLKKKIPEALKECKDCINICRAENDLIMRLPVLHLNMSAVYREDLKDYRKAMFHAEKAYEVSQVLISEDPNNISNNRHLAVSILVMGQLEETFNNKEAAVLWYSQGIEMDNLDNELAKQFKSRLYGITFNKKKSKSLKKRSTSSRQSTRSERRTWVKSKIYNMPDHSIISSTTNYSQFSTVNTRSTKKKEYNIEAIIKIQSFIRMALEKFRYERNRDIYNYFAYTKKSISSGLYFISVYRNIGMQKHKFMMKRLASTIYIEAYPLTFKGKSQQISFELNEICRILNIEAREIVLKSHLNELISKIDIIDGKLILAT